MGGRTTTSVVACSLVVCLLVSREQCVEQLAPSAFVLVYIASMGNRDILCVQECLTSVK